MNQQATTRAEYVSTWIAGRTAAPDMGNALPSALDGVVVESEARRRWFLRPMVVIPLVFVLLVVATASVVGWRAWETLNAIQSVSTPPAAITAEDLGIEGSTLVIDTAPAREAVQAREQDRERGGDGGGSLLAYLQPSTEEPGDDPAVASPFLSSPTSTAEAEASPAALVDGAEIEASTGINILLMGVDARTGQSIDIGVRPDTLAVLNLNEAEGTCRILQIPRDSRVNVPGYGMSKINHALAVGGIPFEVLVVEDYLGITIDHYALVDFTGVTMIVDSFGGVTIDNPAAFSIDRFQFPAGEIHLDGEEALMFLRFRGTSEGDFGRVKNQQLVLRALIDKANTMNVIGLIPESFGLLQDHFRTDLGVRDLISLANTFGGKCTGDSVVATTIPGDVRTLPDDMMQMDLSFVVSDPEDVLRHAAWLIYGEAPPRVAPIDLGTPVASPEASPEVSPLATPSDSAETGMLLRHDP